MCTSIFQVTTDQLHVLGRTMDWPELEVTPIFLPRGYQWANAFNHRVTTNRYAIIGGGYLGRNVIDLSDGVNEHGLMGQKLTFSAAHFCDTRRNDKIQLPAYQFVFWALGRYQSVNDLVNHLDEVELMSERFSDVKYGDPELHFAFADRTGRVVVIEPTANPMVVHDNPLGVVTNTNDFQGEIKKLQRYMNFTPEFLAGHVPLNTPKVTTGNFAGKHNPPGYYAPSARLARAAYLKERAKVPTGESEAIIAVWHLLDSVSVPYNPDHSHTYSVYRSATCAEHLTYYFQSYHQAGMSKLTMTPEMLKWTQPRSYPLPDRLAPRSLN